MSQAQIGFIFNKDGANIRDRPAEQAGSLRLTAAPLPPATRVVVTGTHPDTAAWSRVSAFAGGVIVNGYVQGLRITTDLPEPSAALHYIKKGEVLEALAARIFRQAIEPGRDLRFYEEVTLYVNQKANLAGVQRVRGDIHLFENRLIWLVSVAFAKSLEGVVPSGSITGGLFARARAAVQHLEDIVTSVRMSPDYFGEVAGEYASAIREHWPEILGTVVLFLTAEAASALLAAAPTGVSQLAAAVIQLLLALLGAKGLIEAGMEAVRHAQAWLTQAWKANGNTALLAEASKSFLRMVVSVLIAALAALGIKSNFGRGMKLAQGVRVTPPTLTFMVAANGNGTAVAVPVFKPGSITAVGVVHMSPNPLTGVTAAATQSTKGTNGSGQITKRALDDAELEKLLQDLPNWDALKKLIGRRIPKEGTPEFAAIKRELERAGYRLDVMKEGNQPFRLRRVSASDDTHAALTVTGDGRIVLQNGGTTRISVFSRYRANYLDWIERTQGKAARDAAAARVGSGDQLHHLIPDGVAQRHPLIQEALDRLQGYTIDRGTNILDMPTKPNAQGQIMHLGSHPEYSKYVMSVLDAEMRRLASGGRPLSTVSPAALEGAIQKVEDALRRAIDSGDLPAKVLKELYEDGVLVGKKLGMLELRHEREVAYA